MVFEIWYYYGMLLYIENYMTEQHVTINSSGNNYNNMR